MALQGTVTSVSVVTAQSFCIQTTHQLWGKHCGTQSITTVGQLSTTMHDNA